MEVLLDFIVCKVSSDFEGFSVSDDWTTGEPMTAVSHGPCGSDRRRRMRRHGSRRSRHPLSLTPHPA